MEHFAGLDVSVKDTSVCIVDDTGRIVREVKVASEPEERSSNVRFRSNTGHRTNRRIRSKMTQRWGNRPAFLLIGEDWVLRFRLMVKRGHRGYGPQASEGEAQHGPFCWIGRIGQGDHHLHFG